MNRYHEPGRPCLCGAVDCPSCGPAQGYEVEAADDSDPWDDYDDGDYDDYWADADADRAEDNWRGDRF